MPKIQVSGDRYNITLPKQYLRLFGWKKGMELIFLPGREEKSLTLKEMPKPPLPESGSA